MLNLLIFFDDFERSVLDFGQLYTIKHLKIFFA